MARAGAREDDPGVEIVEFINDVNDRIRLLLVSSGREYDLGLELVSVGSRGMLDESVATVAEPLFLIWASLTDLVDGARGREPDAEASATLVMIRAAKEWLAISRNEAKRELYLDRWMYEECGYERR
jgi:hypothetical protein